ncbi:IS4 family transposase, partial [Hymenobacter roseosalivarius DSM 11622]
MGRFCENRAQTYPIRVEKPTQVVKELTHFCLHTKRWVVERTIARLNANGSLSKEYECKTCRANAWRSLANIQRILK